MKKNLQILFTLCFTFLMLNMNAQTKPDMSNLTHLWTFENGKTLDAVGNADGTLMNGAVVNGSGELELLDTAAHGGYLELPGDQININTYPEITLEIWCTPAPDTNLDIHANMAVCFGGTNGSIGVDYLFYTPGRFGPNAAARLGISCLDSTTPWSQEEGLNYSGLYLPENHYSVITISGTTMDLYVDGALATTGQITKTDNMIANLSNDSAWVGRGDYAADPTWKGTVQLVGLWDKALSADEILWLYQKGSGRAAPTSAINSASARGKVNIYAVDNQLFIQNLPEYQRNISVTIYNINGSIAYQTSNFRNGTSLNLVPGVYIARIETDNDNYVRKLVIQ